MPRRRAVWNNNIMTGFLIFWSTPIFFINHLWPTDAYVFPVMWNL
jgi:hypothetical protein